LTTTSVIGRYAGAIISSVFLSHWGVSIMHDGCHGAFSKNKIMGKVASYYLDFMGSSSFVWKHQHNIGHHANTNTPEDPDAITAHPLIRVSPHRSWKPWHQFQQYYAWILFGFVAARWFFRDIEVLLAGKYDDIPLMKMNTQEKAIFWFGKAWFLFIYFVVPILCLGLKEGFLFFLVLEVFISEQFALHFTVNHYECPLVFPNEKFAETDWGKLQVQTTANYGAGSKLSELWSGGLNCQIEHHLFPTIAHPYFRHLAPIVEKTCKEYNVPYTNFPSFFTAVGGVFDHLKSWGTKPASLK